jgi:hypothetical protein
MSQQSCFLKLAMIFASVQRAPENLNVVVRARYRRRGRSSDVLIAAALGATSSRGGGALHLYQVLFVTDLLLSAPSQGCDLAAKLVGRGHGG